MTDKRKAPAFQFYPGDWQRDKGVQSCSLAARGLWLEMLCAMHDNEPRGKLSTADGKPMGKKAISLLIGCSQNQLTTLLAELKQNGVFSVDDSGVIYSRRMVKDQELSAKRATFGKLGGNPVLVKPNLNHKVNHEDKPNLNHRDKSGLTPAFAVAFTSKESSENASSIGEAHDQPDSVGQADQGQGQQQTTTATPNANANGNHDKAASFESMVSARGKAAKLPAQPGETFQQWLERIKRAEALRKTGGSA